jgi:signal transduction histidine kinase
VYIIIDLLNSVKAFIPFYFILMASAIVVMILIRKGFYRYAKITLLVTSNLLIYIFVTNDNFYAGVYIYFVVTSLMSLALFGYSEKNIAIAFCIVSLVLFFFAYLDFKIFTFTEQELSILNDEEYAKISFLSNFIIVLFVSVLIVFFLLDINQYSERQALTKNEELVKTNEELDRFVYSASHDLRAPLSSITGLINVARYSKSKEELDQCFDMMNERVSTLDKFIGEIIDYSRNSRQEVEKVTVNLLSICHQVVNQLKFTQVLREPAFTFSISPELSFLCDLTRLKIILSNIIGNAMKYQDSAKSLHQIEIIADQKGNTIQIEVKDNGIGISAEHHQRIFDMFYRATETSHGSGLGLYIVKETMSKLEGETQFTSTPGVGSSFIITLPA